MNPLLAFFLCAPFYVCAVEPKTTVVIETGDSIVKYVRGTATEIKETNMYLVEVRSLKENPASLPMWNTSYDFLEWATENTQHRIWAAPYETDTAPVFTPTSGEWRQIEVMREAQDRGPAGFMCKEMNARDAQNSPKKASTPGSPRAENPSKGYSSLSKSLPVTLDIRKSTTTVPT